MVPEESAQQVLVNEGWQQITALPLKSWGEIYLSLERLISLRHSDIRAKFSTWFKPMEFISAWEKEAQVCILLKCSNQHRWQEVEKIRPTLDYLLSSEIFKNREATIRGIFPELASVPAEPDEKIRSLSAVPEPAVEAESAFDTPLSDGGDRLSEGQADAPNPVGKVELNQEGETSATPMLAYYQQKLGIEISEQDLSAVLAALKQTDPARLRALEAERLSTDIEAPGQSESNRPSDFKPAAVAGTPLSDILVDPTYATVYDEIVHSHSAVYLPAYFVRHLRHMGASDGLRFMALRQIAYKRGFKEANGARTVSATLDELVRWSTLSRRILPGNLDEASSYLYLLAGRTKYIEHWETLPKGEKWEDAAGYHWKTKDRSFIIWKKDGHPSDDCSQLYTDYKTQETSWRQAPAIYRVQMSMPLAPEDARSLRDNLLAFGITTNPLEAIAQCLALPRDQIIPDRPEKLTENPKRLVTVQELVMETWGLSDRSLAAQVSAQAKVLENYLLRPNDLLKIPFYLLEKWGPYLSPAQLWTIIILMDRVFVDSSGNEYRDTTVIKRGANEMTLWLEDEFTVGAARKITKWLHPYSQAPKEAGGPGAVFNTWFSVFASEIRSQNGGRAKNADQSSQIRLKVLPIVPLSPEDTIKFALKMGMTRMLVRDAEGNILAIEITPEDFVLYAKGGRTLRYSHAGEQRFGGSDPIVLKALDRDLDGIELISDEQFYDLEVWNDALFRNLESRPDALSRTLENETHALFRNLEKQGHALFRMMKNQPDALFSTLALEPDALFCMLLKLLILNLYGIKNNSIREETPSIPNLSENVDSLEQFGNRQGYYMQWTEESSDSDWEFDKVTKSLGITDIKSLKDAGVSAESLVTCALELFSTPKEKFTAGRIAVLVSKLRKNPESAPGVYQRLTDLGPERLQTLFRRAITSWTASAQDPDWDVSLSKAKREDLIELAEKLALGRVFHIEEEE